jgi:hypothetical protein
MRLGKGYNSFLQKSCAEGMVTPNRKDRTLVTSFDKTAPVSQVVSYSSRFVEKLSDITQLMNISASKSIKSGVIVVSGSLLSVDD